MIIVMVVVVATVVVMAMMVQCYRDLTCSLELCAVIQGASHGQFNGYAAFCQLGRV